MHGSVWHCDLNAPWKCSNGVPYRFQEFVGLEVVDSELVFHYCALLPRAGDFM